MKKYEYLIAKGTIEYGENDLKLLIYPVYCKKYSYNANMTLNQLGELGWDLSCIDNSDLRCGIEFIFKRIIDENK